MIFKKNTSGKAYGLTLLCPIRGGGPNDPPYARMLREHLESLGVDDASPLAHVPNTYMARFYILNDVFYQGHGFREEHLESRYLVFLSHFHGNRDTYVREMWSSSEDAVRAIWRHCVGFDDVEDAQGFVDYVTRCQVDNALFFNGSTDEPLSEQLKALYLKQEFTRFAYDNQGVPPEQLQHNFKEFVELTQPWNPSGPTWQPGSPNS